MVLFVNFIISPNIMDEKSRIQKLLEISNKSLGQFSDMIGIKNSTLSHILNDRNKPSLDVLKKILQRLPEISSDWLILGQGPMYRKEIKSKEPSLFDNIDQSSSFSIDNSVSEHVKLTPQENVVQKKTVIKEDLPISDRQRVSFNDPHKYETEIEQEFNKRENALKHVEIHQVNTEPRKVVKITLYYSDMTFQEFDSK